MEWIRLTNSTLYNVTPNKPHQCDLVLVYAYKYYYIPSLMLFKLQILAILHGTQSKDKRFYVPKVQG